MGVFNMKNIIKLLKSFSDYIGANGCSEDEINEAEKTLLLSFSKEYRTYLREIGLACFNGHEFTGITRNNRLNVVNVTEEQRNNDADVPADWYVVEETYVDGFCVWQDKSGNIYLKSPITTPEQIANSLMEYIELSN